jgi:tRNA(Ile)-lysidine synthase
MTTDLRARFIGFVRHRKLINPGDRVLVAVSGGVDSMVLLHLLQTSAAELGTTVVAAHFDHAMRSTSADDGAWLAGVCRAWDVELISRRARTALHGEAAARIARYAFLTEAARLANASRIATAHHADDQIETVLFRLLRGTGLRGLAGIPLRRGLLVRPLLRFRKHELEHYAVAHQVAFRADETNATDRYARNRIRRALIPVLATVRADSPRAILQLARHAARTEAAWRSLLKSVEAQVILTRSRGAIELARERLLEYDAEIRARIIRGELRRFGIVPDRRTTRDMLQFVEAASSGARFDIAQNIRLERAYDVIRIARAWTAPDDRPVLIATCNEGSGRTRIGGREWQVAWTTRNQPAAAAERFDCQQMTFPLEIRAWQAGDRIRLAYGTKKLKKLFAEARVPVHRRAAIPLLVDAAGRVYWAVGLARAMEAPATEKNPALTITVTDVEIS